MISLRYRGDLHRCHRMAIALATLWTLMMAAWGGDGCRDKDSIANRDPSADGPTIAPLQEARERAQPAVATDVPVRHGRGSCASCGGTAPNREGYAEPSVALRLARICKYESERRPGDCRAIYWVGAKRAALFRTGRTPVDEAWLYSSVSRSNSARARRIRVERPPEPLIKLALELIDQLHEDPCPAAIAWGGAMDTPHKALRRVTCSEKMSNRFYRLQKST